MTDVVKIKDVYNRVKPAKIDMNKVPNFNPKYFNKKIRLIKKFRPPKI